MRWEGCYFERREGDEDFGFDAGTGAPIRTMRNYAVIPMEKYEEIERLTTEGARKDKIIEAALIMAADYEAYEYQRDNKDYSQPIHDPEILVRFQNAVNAASGRQKP